jgi:hypothetical protein
MDSLTPIDYYLDMAERLKALLSDAKEWCSQERGRQSELADFLGVKRQAISAWFAENPQKAPTGEQVLALLEFLRAQKKRRN